MKSSPTLEQGNLVDGFWLYKQISECALGYIQPKSQGPAFYKVISELFSHSHFLQDSWKHFTVRIVLGELFVL